MGSHLSPCPAVSHRRAGCRRRTGTDGDGLGQGVLGGGAEWCPTSRCVVGSRDPERLYPRQLAALSSHQVGSILLEGNPMTENWTFMARSSQI